MANGSSATYPPFGMIEIKIAKSPGQTSSLVSPIDSLPVGNVLVFCENPKLNKLTYYTTDLPDGERFRISFGTNTDRDITRAFKLDGLGSAERSDANVFHSEKFDIGTKRGQALRVEAQQGNRSAPPQIHYDIYTEDQRGQAVPVVFDIDPDGTLGC